MTRRWIGLALALGAGLLPGCATEGTRPEDLPLAPIAVAYRDPEDSRRRAELLAKPEERGNKLGVARINDLQRALGGGDVNAALLQQTLRLALVDPRTGAAQMVESAPRGAEPYAWSPDRRALSFSLATDGVQQIYVWDRPSGEVRRMTHGNQAHGHGALGPGGRAAYARADTADGRSVLRIWITGPRFANPRPLTEGPADRAPVWSPDGAMLAYVSRGADGVDMIQALDPDGDGVPHLLARGRDPVFAPDGAWIVYSARTGSGWRLWKMRPDGSGRLPIGQGSTDVEDEGHPAVSPDGRFVAYVGETKHRQTLRVRRMDGAGDRELLEGADGSSPAW